MRVLFAVGLTLAAALNPSRPAVGRSGSPSGSAAAASSVGLYSQLDSVLQRARKSEGTMGARMAAALLKQWTTAPANELVESTLVAGILDDFDEGLQLLLEAEDTAQLELGGKAYAALMRLGQAAQRPGDVLALLARARARGVERSDTALLNGMSAAADLGDWGAVARLFAELDEGDEAALDEAMFLECMGSECAVLAAEMGAGPAAAAPTTEPTLTVAPALRLALKAHCERSDVPRAVSVMGRMRQREAALTSEEYGQLLELAKRSPSGAPLILAALSPADLYRTVANELEPKFDALRNDIGIKAASLGTVERKLAGAAALGLLVGLATLAFGLPSLDELPGLIPADDPMGILDGLPSPSEAPPPSSSDLDASGLFPADVFSNPLVPSGSDPLGF